MANSARTDMLTIKRRFSKNNSSILSGEGLDEVDERIAVRSCILETKVTVMHPVKTEETLHNYLRRHFEKISRIKEQELAGKREAAGLEVLANRWSSERAGN